MKRNLSILRAAVAFAAFALVLSSCADDCEQGADGPALAISVAEEEGNVPFGEGRRAYVIAIAPDGTVAAQATVEGLPGGQLDGAEPVVAAMQDGGRLVAYSPTGLWTAHDYGLPADFSVPADQSTAEGHAAADLMLAPLTTVSGGRATLVMTHKMAKVTVHLTDVTGIYDLTGATMAMPGRLTTVKADLTTATAMTVEGVEADIVPYSPGNTAYRASATAIVAPGVAAGGSTLVGVSVGSRTFSYSLPEDTEWEAGKEYVYSMRLTTEGLVPYGSHVGAWGEGDGSLWGNAEAVAAEMP